MANLQRTHLSSQKANAKPTSPAIALGSSAPAREKIAARAYQLWLESGRVHGHDLEHWLRAEREIRGPLLPH
jgi:hypothetical protein